MFLVVSYLNAVTFQEVKEIEKKEGTLKALSFYKKLVKNKNLKAMLRLAQIYSKELLKRI